MRKMRLSVIVSTAAMAWSFALVKHFRKPAHFPEPLYDFSANPQDENKIRLGRQLFYDPILSRDGSISCASCHSPYNAFAHTDHDLSHGIGDSIGTRNAPGLFNLAWQPSFMWDGAIHHLDVQPLAPLTHPGEMGETLPEVLQKLRAQSKYQQLFLEAWGDTAITGERMLKSLAQFQLGLVSATARYDSMIRGEVVYNEREQRGYRIFQQHCSSCHREPLFTDYSFRDNGLPVDPELKDIGRMRISGKSDDSLKFRVPSLRNLDFTYPYMHDGRFKTLNEVLRHYAKGVMSRTGTAPELKNGIALSSEEKADLISFLLTLNDRAFILNPEIAFPSEEKSSGTKD